MISNARDRSIESDDTLAVLVFVAYDISTEDIGFIWFNNIAIGGGVKDLPSWVAFSLDELTYLTRPIGCLVCLLRATWDIGGCEFGWEYS
jgi:hypothetical protein